MSELRVVGAVGPEAVGERRRVAGPGHEVGEDEVLDGVERLAVGDRRSGRGPVCSASRRRVRAARTWRAVAPSGTAASGSSWVRNMASTMSCSATSWSTCSRGDADRGDHAVDVADTGVDVVLGLGVARGGEQLGVDGDGVVALDERLERHLPIAGQDAGRRGRSGTGPPGARRRSARAGSRERTRAARRLRVHVHEDESAPGTDAGLGETEGGRHRRGGSPRGRASRRRSRRGSR